MPTRFSRIFQGSLLASMALLVGCSGPTTLLSGTSSSVTISPSAQTIDQGQTASFIATSTSDSTNSGVTWSLSGAGTLSASTATGTTYNAPATVSATTTATLTATSAKTATQTQSVSITVNAAPVITGAALPPGTMNAAYTAALVSTGGTAPITWSVSSGTLPGGLTLSSTGILSGTTTAIGSFTFTLKAADSSSLAATQPMTLVVAAPPLAIATTTLPAVVQGAPYSASLASTGGLAPITWSVSAGVLPAGIALSSAGVLSGTPTSSGILGFTVKASDSSATPLVQTQALSVAVAPKLILTPTTLLAGTAAQAYTPVALQTTGGTGLIAWAVSTGALPSGITLSGTGILFGTPTSAGTASFSVTATDSGTGTLQQSATQALSISINPAPLTIATAALPGGVEGSPYSQILQSAGGTGAVSWSLLTGSLPQGFSLSAAGTVSGIPAAQAVSSFIVKIVDSGAPQQSVTQPFTITINAAPPVVIQTTSLAIGAVGSSYQGPIAVVGGVPPYVSTTTTGVLPPGLAIGPCSGACSGGYFSLNGVPATVGAYNFTIKVTDAENPAQTSSQAYSITINPSLPLGIATSTLGGTVNLPFNTTLQAVGGAQPYTWSIIAGGLPAWATLNRNTGAISGTPASAGSSNFTVQVIDSTVPTPQTATQQFLLPILAAGPNDGQLKGSYAFRFGGFANGNATGSVYGADSVGSFTADGNGNITSGQVDSNQSEAAGGKTGFAEAALRGVYSIGADNRGTIVFTSANITFAVAVGNVSGGVAQTMRLIEFDDTSASAPGGIVGSGEARLQTPSAFNMSTIKGSFVFGFQGESPCNKCGDGGSTIIPYGSVSAVGFFSADGSGNITDGREDAAGVGTSYNAITLTGSVTAPSTATGQGTITLIPTGTTYPAAPTHFAYYIVSPSEMYMMSTDTHATTTLLSGDVLLQQQAAFSINSLSGTSIGYQESGANGDGSSLYPTQSKARLLMLTVTGGGNLGMSEDSNSAGTITSGFHGNVPYSVEAANGRVTITVQGGGAPVIYLANNNLGFGTGQFTSGGDTRGLLTLEPQMSGTFSNTTLSGSYFLGNLLPVDSTTANSGLAAFNNGNGTMTNDVSGPGGTLSSGKQSTFTCSLDPLTGRATLTDSSGGTNILYILSPTKAVLIDTNTTDTTPTVTVIQR